MQLNVNAPAGTAESTQYGDNNGKQLIYVEDFSVTLAPRKKQRTCPLKKMCREKFGSTGSEITSMMSLCKHDCAKVAKCAPSCVHVFL